VTPISTEQLSTQLRLDSWKTLAQYLGRSPRTVQRWHSQYGLPVRHLGGETGSVFAYADELDDWMRERGWHSAAESSASYSRVFREEPVLRDPIPYDDTPSLSPAMGSNENRASQLVTLAQKIWEAVSQANLTTSARLYREAIDLDPLNANAFAGLSLNLIAQGLIGTLHPLSAYEPARAASSRAAEIDPELLEVRCAEAWLKMLQERDWTGARDGFDRVLKRCRSYTPALLGRGLLHLAEGSIPMALSHVLEAWNHRPLSTAVVALRCWCEYLGSRHEAALALVAQARASGHSGAVLDAVDALASVQIDDLGNQIPRLEALVAFSPNHYALRGVLGYAYGVTGQTRKAWDVLESLTAPGLQGNFDHAYPAALTQLGLNETRKAIECLQQSYRYGTLWSLGFHFDPILATLRNDPYFRLA
jgi:tetratricopeptide (TPR) repeat protein